MRKPESCWRSIRRARPCGKLTPRLMPTGWRNWIGLCGAPVSIRSVSAPANPSPKRCSDSLKQGAAGGEGESVAVRQAPEAVGGMDDTLPPHPNPLPWGEGELFADLEIAKRFGFTRRPAA